MMNQTVLSKEEEITNLKIEMKRRQSEAKTQLQILNKQLQAKDLELIELRKQVNVDSISSMSGISNISKKNSTSNNYSFDLGEYFQNYPQTTLQLLKSLPEEKPTDEKQLGDMLCMLISRDGNSVQLFGSVNRTFLKRKLKQEENRFRIVIIYKPDRE